MLKKCPWCGFPPTTVTYEETSLVHIRCLEETCRVTPHTRFYTDRQKAVDGWNNPLNKTKSYSEDQIKKIFSENMVDEDIWKEFFPDSPLWQL